MLGQWMNDVMKKVKGWLPKSVKGWLFRGERGWPVGLKVTTRVVLLDNENLYNLVYLLMSLLALFYPQLYIYLLFDFLRSSSSILQVLQAVKANLPILLKTLCFLGIVTYLYAVIFFLFFSDLMDLSAIKQP